MEMGSTKDTKRHEVNHLDLDRDRDRDRKGNREEKTLAKHAKNAKIFSF